jgi:predicted permease
MPFFRILTSVIFPVFFIIAAGYFVQKRLRFDVSGLTKVIFYILIPPLIFSRIYQSSLSAGEYGITVLFTFCIVTVMGLLTFPVSAIRGYSAPMRSAFALSVMFYNSGNYGLPVVELLFHQNPAATSIQAVVLAVQNITTFTAGIFIVSRGRRTYGESFRTVLRYPLIYSVALALLLKWFRIPVWEPLWEPINRLASALVPVALLTLGAQLARIRLTSSIVDVALSGFFRLILAPLTGLAAVSLLPVSGMNAQVLVISASMPTAVNTALLAIELKNEPQFASQAVFFSTLFSIATVSVVIYAVTALL